MKIAMFSDAFMPRINGVAISVDSYSRQLISLGHEVLIVCPKYIEKESDIPTYFTENQTRVNDEDLPYEVFRVPGMKLVFSKEDRLARLEHWFSVKDRVDQFKPDIIHLHSEYFIGYFGFTYAKYRMVPLFYTFHTLWDEYVAGYIPRRYGGDIVKAISRRMIRFYLKHSDVIIVPTTRIESIARNDYGISSNITILPTGISGNFVNVDKEELETHKNAFYKKYPELKNKRILLFVGRVAKEKNLDFLYDVFERLQTKIEDIALLFIGGGPYLEELKQNAKKRNLTNSAFFTGYVDRAELPYIYTFSNIFIFPSKTETQGLVTIESMLRGTPVVAIGERGTIDVMQGDNGGFMVQDSLDDFTERVYELLTNNDLYREKSKEAIAWGQSWTIEALTEKLVSLYESFIY